MIMLIMIVTMMTMMYHNHDSVRSNGPTTGRRCRRSGLRSGARRSRSGRPAAGGSARRTPRPSCPAPARRIAARGSVRKSIGDSAARPIRIGLDRRALVENWQVTQQGVACTAAQDRQSRRTSSATAVIHSRKPSSVRRPNGDPMARSAARKRL
jgi:hypothetical protein